MGQYSAFYESSFIKLLLLFDVSHKRYAARSKEILVYFTTRGHLFFKISRFILGVGQPYFACPSESICPRWGLNVGFCSSAVKKFFQKSLLKICIFCELDF